MELGISTASFFNKLTTEEAFDVLKGMGVSVTEIFLSTQSEYEPSFALMLRERLGDGLRVHSVHALGSQYEPELFSKNARVRQDAEVVFKKFLGAVKILGASYYTFHGQYKLKRWGDVPNLEYMSSRLIELNRIASDYGVEISYENVHYTYALTPDFFANLLPLYPKLQTTFDIKQAIFSEHTPKSYLEVMSKNLSTVHICDVNKEHKTALIGKGCIDFEDFFKNCAKYNVTAPVLLENYCNDYNDFDELHSSFLYTQNIMKKHNVLS